MIMNKRLYVSTKWRTHCSDPHETERPIELTKFMKGFQQAFPNAKVSHFRSHQPGRVLLIFAVRFSSDEESLILEKLKSNPNIEISTYCP